MSKDSTLWEAKRRILGWSKTVKPLPPASSQPFSTSRPTHNLVADARTAQNPSDKSVEFPDETITLHVGPDAAGRSFCVRKDLFHSATTFSSDITGSRVVFPPDLIEDDPMVFDMFVDWLDRQEDPRPYIPLQYSPEPWRSHGATAWVFGQKIRAAQFERYALSQFITNCATVNLIVWKYIEMRAEDKSSLRRFSNHWIAWNHHLVPAGQSEYKDLSAAKLASSVSDDTIDPRIFDLDHWYSVCGDDINSTCIHDPIVRENLVQNVLSIAHKQQPDEWGRDWETKNEARRKESIDSPHSSPNTKVSGTKIMQVPPAVPPRPRRNPTSASPKAYVSGTNNTKPTPPPIPPSPRRNLGSS